MGFPPEPIALMVGNHIESWRRERSADVNGLLANRGASRRLRRTLPKNSDIGGHHIALYVDDIDKAAAYLKDKNVKTMQGPIPIKEGPAAGQSILYFFAPWGLQIELISYPKEWLMTRVRSHCSG
jgi:catechol 2,3-dioxygenase-like lactoylglutathione lyase family enzyme